MSDTPITDKWIEAEPDAGEIVPAFVARKLERENAELKIISQSADATCEEQRKHIAAQNRLVEQMAEALRAADANLRMQGGDRNVMNRIKAALGAAKGGK